MSTVTFCTQSLAGESQAGSEQVCTTTAASPWDDDHPKRRPTPKASNLKRSEASEPRPEHRGCVSAARFACAPVIYKRQIC